jgi:hypothetical protein
VIGHQAMMAKAMPKDGCHGRLLELFHAWIPFKLLFMAIVV